MIDAVTVVVPAHNEEDTVTDCLTSVLSSLEESGRESYVVVAADSCSDSTARRSREVLGGRGLVVEGEWRNAGAARFAGTKAALCHAPQVHLGSLWLANTDADSIVPPDWVRSQLKYGDGGFAAVAGVVTVTSFDGHPEGTEDLFWQTYLLPESGGHPHVHGANLGVLAAAYMTVGGWPKVALAEDHALWNRLRAGGWQTISPRDVVVHTSGRPHGRAPGGFADTLRELGLGRGK